MDVNGIFNDVYERVEVYYKKKKTMIKSEVGKKDNKFKEFWINRDVDNYFFTNIKVSVTQNEIIVHSLSGVIPDLKICVEAFEWLGYSDERKNWLLSYALEQHEKLLLEHYALLFSEVRHIAINSHKDITRHGIMAFFASIDTLAYVADYVNHSTDSVFFAYLDTQPKPVKMKVVFSEEGENLIIDASVGNVGKVSKVPKGTQLQDVLYCILDGNENLDKAIGNLFKGVAK